LLDYFSAIARRWGDLLFGESILAVVFLVAWGFDKLSPNGLAAIFIVAMFIAGYYTWRADHVRLLPRLEVERAPMVQWSPTVNPQNQPTGYSVNYQLVVNCSTDAVVKNCRGHLLKVLKLAADGSFEPTPINEALGIQWTADNQTLPRTMYPGVPQRLNLFFAHSDGNTVLSTIPLPMRAVTVLNRDDLFRFFVRITADDCAPIDEVMEIRIGADPEHPMALRLLAATDLGR